MQAPVVGAQKRVQFRLPLLEGKGVGERPPREGATHQDSEGSIGD